jgi:hypothetical protein
VLLNRGCPPVNERLCGTLGIPLPPSSRRTRTKENAPSYRTVVCSEATPLVPEFIIPAIIPKPWVFSRVSKFSFTNHHLAHHNHRRLSNAETLGRLVFVNFGQGCQNCPSETKVGIPMRTKSIVDGIVGESILKLQRSHRHAKFLKVLSENRISIKYNRRSGEGAKDLYQLFNVISDFRTDIAL